MGVLDSSFEDMYSATTLVLPKQIKCGKNLKNLLQVSEACFGRTKVVALYVILLDKKLNKVKSFMHISFQFHVRLLFTTIWKM